MKLLSHPVPARTRAGDYLGAAALTALVNQGVTGLLLAFFYRPTPAEAHASLQALTASPAGALLRGLHHWGADALVVLGCLHALRVFVRGAYRPPRQLTWVAGCGLLALLLAAAWTGYLLPWDQAGYWSTAVGTAMAGYVAPALTAWLRGGPWLGGATLLRFYALHALLLPALAAGLLGIHLALVWHHGLVVGDGQGQRRPFWLGAGPGITLAGALVAGGLFALAAQLPAPLGPSADPLNRAGYVPLPPWYFLGLYESLKYLPDFVGIVLLPGLLAAAALLVPLVGHRPDRGRLVPLAGGICALGLALLTLRGWQSTRTALAPPAASQVSYARDVRPVLLANCLPCHGSKDPAGGLDLTSYGALKASRALRPGDPQGSLLVQVLDGSARDVPPMPLGRPSLPPSLRQRIADWVRAGAADN